MFVPLPRHQNSENLSASNQTGCLQQQEVQEEHRESGTSLAVTQISDRKRHITRENS
eukprot:m.547950 g.547950  ORF g.547950 m.547950 type:complete len:57 (-) comp22158_c1_seq19:478-648(-)